MKTLEEALDAAFKISKAELASDSLRVRNAEDICRDISNSPRVVEYLNGLLEALWYTLPDGLERDDELFYPFFMAALTRACFAGGVRVGIEMERP